MSQRVTTTGVPPSAPNKAMGDLIRGASMDQSRRDKEKIFLELINRSKKAEK